MAVLALAFIAMGALDDHPIGILNEHTLLPVELGITAVFALEFVIRLYAAESRSRYLRAHWIDLLALLPAIRFLRFLRLGRTVYLLRAAQLLRLGIFVRFLAQINRAANQIEWIAKRNGVHVALLAATGLVVIGGSVVWQFEHTVNHWYANFGNAMWWAISTVATLGYGDGPVTWQGRAVAVFLMVIGVGCFGLITATVTTLFVERSSASPDSTAQILSVLNDIQRRLDRLEAKGRRKAA